jgi:AcrR family transcriptional regulator
MATAPARRALKIPGWIGSGDEEAEFLSGLPESVRLRRLVDDLETLMMAEGFLEFSTDDIARRLRCSKATLYRLAASREELFELVIGRWLARFRDVGWQEVQAADDWPSRLVRYLGAAPTGVRDASYKFMRDVYALAGGYRMMLDHQQRRMACLEAIIAAGVKAGAYQDVHPRVAADLILSSVRRLVDPDFLASVGLSVAEATEEWYRVLEFGLLRPGTTAPRARRRKPPARPRRST